MYNTETSTSRYQVRLDAARMRDTQLLFVTTGILLRYLAGDVLLSAFSHVIVDEVRRMPALDLMLEVFNQPGKSGSEYDDCDET